MCSVFIKQSEKLTLDRSTLLYAYYNSMNTQGKEGGREGGGKRGGGVRKGEGEGGREMGMGKQSLQE